MHKQNLNFFPRAVFASAGLVLFLFLAAACNGSPAPAPTTPAPGGTSATSTQSTPSPAPSLTASPTPTQTPAPDAFVLNIDSPQSSEVVTSSPQITVSGQTRADAVLTVNDQFVSPDANGRFSTVVSLQEGPNNIEVVASIASGDQLSKVLTVIYSP